MFLRLGSNMRFLLRSIFVVGFIAFSFEGSSQKLLSWEIFQEIEYQFKYSIKLNSYYQKPTFPKSLIELNSEQIKMNGFIQLSPIDSISYVFNQEPVFFGLCGDPGRYIQLENFNGTEFQLDRVKAIKAVVTGVLRLEDESHYSDVFIDVKEVKINESQK